METYRNQKEKLMPEDEVPADPADVLHSTIKKLDELFDEDAAKVIRALVAYYDVDVGYEASGDGEENEDED